MVREREIAASVIFDESGRILLQLRDDIPGIMQPGKIGLFGGHREGDETFLECVVRELNEELSYFVPPERFERIAVFEGPDLEVEGGLLRGEFFVTRDVPVTKLRVTEGALKIISTDELVDIASKLTPFATFALDALFSGEKS